jgi:hypothetical protein
VPSIVLATLNARWSHASLGLRYLRANLGVLRDDSVIAEYTIARPVGEIVADLLARGPRLVGFGVYIWNVARTTEVIAALKAAAPQITRGRRRTGSEPRDRRAAHLRAGRLRRHRLGRCHLCQALRSRSCTGRAH